VVVAKHAMKKTRSKNHRISKVRLAEMIEEATVDAYGESEQVTGWFTMIDENLAGALRDDGARHACHRRRGRSERQRADRRLLQAWSRPASLPILDLPLPTPPPSGAEWNRGIPAVAR